MSRYPVKAPQPMSFADVPDGYIVQRDGDEFTGVDPATLGGGGSPGGSNTQLQYNNAGAFAGAANATYASGRLGLATPVELAAVAAPSAPGAGKVALYGVDAAKRIIPAFLGPSGVQELVAAYQGLRRVHTLRVPGSGSSPDLSGPWAFSVAGSAAVQALAAGSFLSQCFRIRYTSAASANATTGVYGSGVHAYLGDGTRRGGFMLAIRFGWEDWQAGGRVFVGFHANATLLNVDPSTRANSIGIGKDAGDTNYQLLRVDNAGNAAKTDLGVAPADGDVFDLLLWSAPNSGEVGAWVIDAATGSDVLAPTNYTTGLPASTALLRTQVLAGTGAGTSAIQISLMHAQLEAYS